MGKKKKYYPRKIESLLRDYLKIFPVVCVTGPRQSGKSTLIQHMIEDDYKFISMDDVSTRKLFEADPVLFIRNYNNRVIFDEAQKTPELFEYIKMEVDKDRNNYGKFVLSGSSQFVLMSKINESLAGRAGMLTLLPFEFREVPDDKREKLTWSGSYPELVLRKFRGAKYWYNSYIETYIKKDLSDISKIANMRDFSRCLHLLAGRVGQTLNLSKSASELGISQPTLKNWISILEASYIIFLLPPFFNNFGKRIIKSPKIYFYDTGLLTYLNNIHSEALLESSDIKGEIFENFIISEYKKKIFHSALNEQLYYIRTNHGTEVDLIVDKGQNQTLIEIKSSMTFKPEFLQNMQKLSGQSNKVVVYKGKNMTEYDEKVKIINYKTFLD